MLLLDNCSTHKTELVFDLLNTLRVPKMYSAPASYLAIPVERLFGSIEINDFEMQEDPSSLKKVLPNAKRYTHVQIIMAKIAEYLFKV